MPAANEVIIFRMYAFTPSVKSSTPQPFVGLGIVMQDRTALRYPQNFANVEADALQRTRAAIHAGSETSGRVPDIVRPQLVLALPVLITKYYNATDIPN
jgi:hypothetical protein